MNFKRIFAGIIILMISLTAFSCNNNTQKAKELNEKGYIYMRPDHYEEAITYFDQALEADPTYVKAWSNKAVCLNNLEKHEEAIKCCDKAIEIDPSYGNAWVNKGNSLLALMNPDEAIKCYDKALEINPSDNAAKTNKGIAIEASKDLEEFLKNNPDAVK